MKKQETRITIRFPSQVANDLRIIAEQEERSINWEVVEAVRQYLERKKAKDATR
jgi:predicted transcriptional regulator